MRGTITRIIVLLILIIVVGCGGSGGRDSSDDNRPQSPDYGNHSVETAKYLPFGTSHSQRFVLDNIADYYKIVVSSPGKILLSLSSDEDLYMELLDSSMNRVDHTFPQHGTNDTITYFTDISGEYYVKVGYDMLFSGSSSAYTMSVNFENDLGPRGDISFTLTWSWNGSSRGEGPDIDIWVTDPKGHTLSSSGYNYSLGPCPDGGEIDFDDLGGWGDGDGGGPERAYWPPRRGPSGTYTYGVRYYHGDGTANYILNVYKGRILYTTKTGTLTSKGNAITLGSVKI
jgi:hypothetical protein